VDTNGLAVASLHADPYLKASFCKPDDETKKYLYGHILSQMLNVNRKFSKDFGQIVMCVDGSNTWRNDVFEYYKSARKEKRKTEAINWNLFNQYLNEFHDDVNEYLPWIAIRDDKAEADDGIGVLTRYITKNTVQMRGVFEQSESILIVSSDHDYKSLQVHENVQQYSKRDDTMIVSERPKLDLLTKIMKGDEGDGVPNFKSPDDQFVTKEKRQPPVSQKLIDTFYEKMMAGEPLPFEDDIQKQRFMRNQILVDFAKIPVSIRERIVNQYTSHQGKKKNTMKMMNFFVTMGLDNFMGNINEF
jgi:glutathione peroxidase-family protein